jgi:WD40 repeat protein
MEHTDIPVFGAFSSDGRLAVTTSYDGSARVWDVTSGKLALPPLNHVGVVTYAGFSLDGRQLVTYSDQGARVWDLTTGRAITAPMPVPSTVAHLDFLPDNRHLLMVLADRSALYWELPSGQPLTLPGPQAVLPASVSVRGVGQLPVETRPVAELARLARLLSGHEIHDDSGLVPVDAARLRQAWEARPH